MKKPNSSNKNEVARKLEKEVENNPPKMGQTTPQDEDSRSIRNITQEDVLYNLLVIPPDGGWGWVVLIASFFINFIMDGTIYSIGLFLDDIAETMHVQPTIVAYGSSILIGINFLAAPIVCGLTNKYGFRIVAFIGGLMAVMVIFATSWLTNIKLFLVVFGGLGGVACSLIYVPSIVIVGFYFERWRALASAISVCGSSCGIISFPVLLNNVLAEYHWTIKFKFLAIIFMIVVVCSLTFEPLAPVSILPNTELEDSALSIFLGAERGVDLAKLYGSYHNRVYPTMAAVQDSQPQPSIRRNYSSSSTLITTGFPGASSTAVSKMSTVFEGEARMSFSEKFSIYRKKTFKFLCCKCGGSRTIPNITPTISRPMYRDDILFAGSVYTLPEYQRKPTVKGTPSKKSAIDYHLSVTRVATQKDFDEEAKTFVCCPEALKRILATMLDFSLLKSPSFMCLSVSGFLVSLGMYVPFVYIVKMATEKGIDHKIADMMVTGLGVSNLCGRIACGILVSIPHVNAVVVSYLALFVAGFPSIYFAFDNSQWMLYVYVALYGSSIATVPSLKTIVIVDLLGLDKLTNAFGITVMFQGISCLIGLPIAGFVIESTGSFGASFIYSGCTIILGGIMLIPIKFISRREKKK